MAATDSSVFGIPSLFQASTKVVVGHLATFEDSLRETPDSVKHVLLRLMSKRGLLTDENIEKVLYPRIRSLDLSTSDVSDHCLMRLPTLRHLCKIDLNSFKESKESTTSEGIMHVSRMCPHLQIVYLRRNVNVTDEGIVALSKNCPQLAELNVGGCSLLTDVTLQALGENARHLRSLNIIAIQATDEGIYSLCQGECSRTLTELDMSGVKSLTDDAVELLIDSCPRIRILLFSRCPNITENARLSLEERLNSTGAKMKQVSWTVY